MKDKNQKAKRGIPLKSNFNEWYPFIVEAAELIDKRYPIKGMDVWKPYGLRAMSLIDSLTRNQMSMTDHHEHRFPLLVPENLLDKENKLVSRLKAAREAGVDPSELRASTRAPFLANISTISLPNSSIFSAPKVC